MRHLLYKAAAALAAAALAGALSAAAAGAAIVNGPAYTNLSPGPALAGYQVNGNGLRAYNDVRGTAFIPSGSTSNLAVYLQTNASSGGQTAELALVRGAFFCSATQWGLEYGYGAAAAPGPLALVTLTEASGAVCLNAGSSYYLEVHYSTLLHEIAFVAGPTETDNNTLNSVSSGGLQIFRAPAVGVHYTSALPTVNTEQASFTRDGLTSLDHPTWPHGGTNSRLNLASQNTLLVDALPTGTAPTVLDPVFLAPSVFGSGGSFSVNATP